MNKIIFKYLCREYDFTIESFTNYTLIEKSTGSTIKMAKLFISLRKIFTVDDDLLIEVFDEWAHMHSIAMVMDRAEP